ncbi:kinase-like domain-containing protein [Xylaria sp. FL1042]|nr:kinase-like domain-containing protein [Xylaria sp. FL1042]
MSDKQPIAQIFCRYINKPLPGHFRAGRGFIDSRGHREIRPVEMSHDSLDISLFPGQPVRVGRDIEQNDISILHPNVSRRHLTIYSIEYEENAKPLVYVRDYNSLCGTYVDSTCPRSTRVSPTSGYLLSQGGIIRIKPYWEFHVYLLGTQTIGSSLGQLRTRETGLFRTRFLITTQTLGSGALAAVHLAINLKTGHQVACKIHRLDRFRSLQGSSSIIRRILDETNILSRLTHPNLLKFVAAFRSYDTLYTFTELAMGGDLFSMRLKYPNGLPEVDTQLIIRQIVEAISYLHEQKVAHRDLKPENVFFTTGPEVMTRVIVGDLGFAKADVSGRMKSEIGTQKFTAPEVYRGQSYGVEVDIWSIGMISLFLVTLDWNSIGCFDALDQNAVDESLIVVFDDLSRLDIRLSNGFRDFIRSCLSVAPSERMTARASKDHIWFRSSGPQLTAQIEELTKEWKPSQTVHNSVEDLNLFDDTSAQNVSSTTSLVQREAKDDRGLVKSTQQSHYFMNSNSTSHKRQKAVPVPPVIKLIGIC